jgi:hypothetical protein
VIGDWGRKRSSGFLFDPQSTICHHSFLRPFVFISGLNIFLKVSALRGSIALAGWTFAECCCRICGIFSALRSGLGKGRSEAKAKRSLPTKKRLLPFLPR